MEKFHLPCFFPHTLRTVVPIIENVQPQSHNLDRHHPLAVKTCVRIQDPCTHLWNECGTITSTNPIGHSYLIPLDSGTTTVRNRRYIHSSYINSLFFVLWKMTGGGGCSIPYIIGYWYCLYGIVHLISIGCYLICIV